MKIKDAIIKAVEERNAQMAGKIVDTLRFRYGCNYNQCLEIFQRTVEISPTEFENLMYLSDMGY